MSAEREAYISKAIDVTTNHEYCRFGKEWVAVAETKLNDGPVGPDSRTLALVGPDTGRTWHGPDDLVIVRDRQPNLPEKLREALKGWSGSRDDLDRMVERALASFIEHFDETRAEMIAAADRMTAGHMNNDLVIDKVRELLLGGSS